mgnify:CR=1 FL=1
MNIIREYILIAVVLIASIFIAYWTYPANPKVINCSIAEISPDYTNDMKEACRKERMAK